MIRKPIVNGQFYPDSRKELEKLITGFSSPAPSKIRAKGLILPHAGYPYSGKVAARTLSQVLPQKKIIILGTNHTGQGKNFSLWAKGEWETPYGKIKIDENLAETILAKGSYIEEDYSAHENEHSIEVQLPILSYFFKEFSFAPISCKISTLQEYRNASSQLFEAVKNIKNEVLLIASTDFTHYEPDSTARKKDRRALEAIINLDEEDLIDSVGKENITMCGLAPVAVLISCLKKLGARKAQVALYQTSGDAFGDYSSVVGYAGVIIK